MTENKAAFIEQLQNAFLEGDAKRYAHLRARPVVHTRTERGNEFLHHAVEEPKEGLCVTGNSCAALALDFIEYYL